MTRWLIVFFSLAWQALFAQNQQLHIELKMGVNHVQLDSQASSFAFYGNFSGLKVLVDGEEIGLFQNPHFKQVVSQLLIPRQPIRILVLKSIEAKDLILKTFNSGKTPAFPKPKFLNKKDCELPPYIDQDVWRNGLPEPKPNPSKNSVGHVIVHHSATSNAATDFTKVVREIYLYHTNGNGWDDIGYNYLVAPDGTLYAGRDGQGLMDDEVKGAHFCAKNTNTMGVCLLGDYSKSQEPSDTMLGTLRDLLSWKLKKEELQPFGKSKHPIGDPNAIWLPTIAGHRDGCSTECPGTKVYAQLETLREKVAEELLKCGFPVGNIKIDQIAKTTLSIQGNTLLATSNEQKAKLKLYTLNGSLIEKSKVNLTKQLQAGVYILVTETENGEVFPQKVVLY